MLRTAALRASQGQEATAALLTQSRQYFSLTADFSEDVGGAAKSSKSAPNVVGEWSNTKSATEKAMKLMQMYKDLGDFEQQPYLKFHNPRTFEDMDKPIPNFKKFGLKSGDVPKFFDGVLAKRAGEAVTLKGHWWDARRDVALEGVKEKQFKLFPKLPVPSWSLGQPVALDELKRVTDTYYKALEPSRKLKLQQMPAQVTEQLQALEKSTGADGAALKAILEKAVGDSAYVEEGGSKLPGFRYFSAAEANKIVALRRKQVHSRWLNLWARRIMASPEQALVPLKERDAMLASKHEDVSPKYNALMNLVARGSKPYGQRLAECAAMDGFFLKRSKQELIDMFPVSEQESEAVDLASKLEDKAWAMEHLLGPTLQPEGATNRLKSEEARALTEHLYTPDRYMYAEGMKLAKRYEEEEAELAEKLKKLTGSADGLLAAQRSPSTPLQRLAAHQREVAELVESLKAARAAAKGNPYLEYALDKQLAYVSDPANIAFEELELPQLIQERLQIEMAELDAEEAKLIEAEEEEMWMLTLQQQARHIAQHIEFDLPQAVVAHMDPLLYKKLDWELTNGQDLMHHEAVQAADCEQGEYVKDQMGLEHLSHHLLPLLRYRRQKYRKTLGYYPPELSSVPVKAKLVV